MTRNDGQVVTPTGCLLSFHCTARTGNCTSSSSLYHCLENGEGQMLQQQQQPLLCSSNGSVQRKRFAATVPGFCFITHVPPHFFLLTGEESEQEEMSTGTRGWGVGTGTLHFVGR